MRRAPHGGRTGASARRWTGRSLPAARQVVDQQRDLGGRQGVEDAAEVLGDAFLQVDKPVALLALRPDHNVAELAADRQVVSLGGGVLYVERLAAVRAGRADL